MQFLKIVLKGKECALFFIPDGWNVDVKAGPPAATFDLEVTFRMEPMHSRTQTRKSLSPDTVGYLPAQDLLSAPTKLSYIGEGVFYLV